MDEQVTILSGDALDEVVSKVAEELGESVKRFKERPEPEEDEARPTDVGVVAEPAIELVPRVKTIEEVIELGLAEECFKKALTQRSFSGRNPELGPMIKCAQCGLRHRDNVKHEPIKYKEGTTQAEHGRPVANAAGFRAK